MPHRSRTIAVYPGSFDPVTLGHLDLIRRAARLFNVLVVGVGKNPDKAETFTLSERLALLRPHLAHLTNVRAEAYEGLTGDFARQHGAQWLVRGIRDVADLSNEVQIANINRAIADVETVFLLTRDDYVLTSSTYVKQIYEMSNGDARRLERLVPPNVARGLQEKLGRPRRTRRRRP